MGGMRLGQQAGGKGRVGLLAQDGSQCQQIAHQNPPHQGKSMLRNGPGPKRSDICATDTDTGPGPSAARDAAE
ncbi:MAG: hypothetical protein RLZZ563_486 [Pseudomonadota bacterium]